jgi:hypothetical protein
MCLMQKKKKFRWKRLVLYSFAIILLLGISGLFAMNYAVDKVIDSMADSLASEVIMEPESTPPLEATIGKKPTIGSMNQEVDSATLQGHSSKEIEKTAQFNANSKQSSSQVKSDNNDLDKVGVYAPEVSTKKAKAIKENVTVSDKASVTSILMGNLGLSDLKTFQEMASGGLTVDEKREARKVLLDKLSPEEYNKLAAIAKKYGVSRGKNYDEAAKEEASTEQAEAAQ